MCSLSVGCEMPSFCGNEQTADAVLHQIAIGLRAKMRTRVLQPFQNLKAAFIRQRAGNLNANHLVNLPNN